MSTELVFVAICRFNNTSRTSLKHCLSPKQAIFGSESMFRTSLEHFMSTELVFLAICGLNYTPRVSLKHCVSSNQVVAAILGSKATLRTSLEHYNIYRTSICSNMWVQ